MDLAKSAADAGIWDWDIACGRIEWSPEMFRLFGIDPGKTPPDLIHGSLRFTGRPAGGD